MRHHVPDNLTRSPSYPSRNGQFEIRDRIRRARVNVAELLIRCLPAIDFSIYEHGPVDKQRTAEPAFPRAAFGGRRKVCPFHRDENRFDCLRRHLSGNAADIDRKLERLADGILRKTGGLADVLHLAEDFSSYSLFGEIKCRQFSFNEPVHGLRAAYEK